MAPEKKEIRVNCKVAHKYIAIRNPFTVWFVTLYNEKEEPFFEFQFDDSFPSREKQWV